MFILECKPNTHNEERIGIRQGLPSNGLDPPNCMTTISDMLAWMIGSDARQAYFAVQASRSLETIMNTLVHAAPASQVKLVHPVNEP
jgi:hypothetical protein